MKKLIFTSLFILLFASCGGPDNGAEETDGISLSDHRIFVSSTTTTGTMTGGTGATGLEKADNKCKILAKAAGLTRDYKAILSDSDFHASNRLVITGAIFVVNGQSVAHEIADSAAALWDTDSSPLSNSVDYTEAGTLKSGVQVWTGTQEDGTLALNHCDKWSDSTEDGDYGENVNKDSKWLDAGTAASCSNSKHLYCISQ